MDDQPPLTLGEVLDELAFAREWRFERANADELTDLNSATQDRRSNEHDL